MAIRIERGINMFGKKIYPLDEVYGISRDVPLNYVERENVDEVFRKNLRRGKHITIFGSSKQGKTCLRKHCLDTSKYIVIQCSNKWTLSDLNAHILKQAGYELTESTKMSMSGKAKLIASIKSKFLPVDVGAESSLEEGEESETVYRQLELDIDDANDVISALKEINFSKYIVLEDFHYLKQEVQKDFAVELKAFHENSTLCFIVVGVWLDENKLVIYNGDLTGRTVSVNADAWTQHELTQVIENGASLLNIGFNQNFVSSLLTECNGNVYIVQEACYRVCEQENVTETQKTYKEIGDRSNAKDIVKNIVKEQSGRYNAFITNYAMGFQETTLEMHKWLLYPILTADTDTLMQGLNYRSIRILLEFVHPKKGELNPGNVTQALKSVVSLQLSKSIQPIILDYDESNLKLHIVDRGFVIWLKTQNRDEILELAGLPINLEN